MPREASKRNNWEKERRERFNKSFEELAKVLPSYDPTITLSRVDILKEAINTITESKQEISKLSKSTEETKTFKDNLIKKLQERIKKLLIRNEQLNKLFKNAGIRLPRYVGTVKQFKKGLWSNRISNNKKALEKSKMEKENVCASSPQTKMTKTKMLTANQVLKDSKIGNPVKAPVPKKFNRKVMTTNNLLLFSRLPMIPTFNQHFVLVPNQPVVNNIRTAAVSASVRPPKRRKPVNATSSRMAPTLPNIGSSTLILANGSIISVVTQPQILIPPFPLQSNPVVNPSLPKTTNVIIDSNLPKTTSSMVIRNINFKKNSLIIPKTCITNTTQINKVPIPAFTSKYANTSLLLKPKIPRESKDKKTEKTENNVKINKRKSNQKSEQPKKRKKCENCDKKKDTDGNEETVNTEKPEMTENTKLQLHSENTEVTIESNTVIVGTSNTNPNVDDNIDLSATQSLTTSSDSKLIQKEVLKKELPQKESLTEISEEAEIVETVNDITNKPLEVDSIASNCATDQTEISEKSEIITSSAVTTTTTGLSVSSCSSITPLATSSVVSFTSSCSTNITNSNHEDAIKNIDLNLVHSDLSNDIFASLQVPPGCQNMESTSPTAAFLLAFPLVSSIKVTEVIDEDNSNSQRETPTLLQIGNMDSSKPSQNDSLLNLDNFSFFSSKEMCGNYYNSKIEDSNVSNLAVEKHSDAVMPTENEKSKNTEYDYTDNVQISNNKEINNPISSKDSGCKISYESQTLLETNSSLSESGKIFQTSENITDNQNMVQNKEYALYEHKSKESNTNVFVSTESNRKMDQFQATTNELPQIINNKNNINNKVHNSETFNEIVQEKVENNCNVNIGYNMTDGNMCKESVENVNNTIISDNYKNYKNVHVNQEHSSTQIFKENSSNQFTSNNKVAMVPKQFSKTDQNNLNNNFTNNSAKVSNTVNQNLVKAETNKIEDTYLYETAPNLQFSKTEQSNLNNNFSSTSTKVSDTPSQSLDKSETSKIRATYHYNPEQYLQSTQNNINNFTPNAAKIIEEPNQNLEKSTNGTKLVESYHYNQKQFITNNSKNLNQFPHTIAKLNEETGPNLEKTSDVNKLRETYSYNPKQFLLTEQRHNYPHNPGKIAEGLSKTLEKSDTNTTRELYNYNTKRCLSNDQHNLNIPHSAKITEGVAQKLEKPEIDRTRGMYNYNTKQFLPNEQANLNIFPNQPTKISEGTIQNVEKLSETSKTYYNSKQYIHNNEHHNLGTFTPNSLKISDDPNQNLEKSLKSYNYNPFEVVQTSKEATLAVRENCKVINSIDKERQIKATDNNQRLDEGCSKPVEEKSCYFSSNYPGTSYRSNSSKICPTCSYENVNKNYTNPFYTNCNYTHNYSDANFNQNYYKSDGKSCYSLNYENYQEYRKAEPSFIRDRRNSASKEKVVQNKPVNWMTTEQKSQTSDCFLPSFTNQSYSFTSCISTETADMNNFVDPKKTTDIPDKRFTWSPSKLPNFLEPTHNLITPTLPTLVGDLALGNALPLAESKTDYKYPKDVKRKTYDQANFLSVSQLVNQTKPDSTPARTISRRLSGSKSKNAATTKNKRFDKNSDKSTKAVNNYSDMFYDQKNRSGTKNISSNYSAEALIGNQCPQEEKKFAQNANKLCSSNFLTENIVTYFTTGEDTYMNQNQNFHTYTHNSFQNNNYSTNTFIYTTPSISSSYLPNNFESSDYSAEGIMSYCGLKDNKNCGNKNYRSSTKEDRNMSYTTNVKKNKKVNQTNNTGLGNFEYPLLPIQGSTSSPILPDDFQTHSTFLPPTTPYGCKNSLYQKQANEFNTTPLLPLPGITRTNIQHPEVSPSLNPVGTSLTNFNLSTIFPEINKGTIPNVHSNSNKSKNSSSYLDVPFNSESKYGFAG